MDNITCPHCRKTFSIPQAIIHQLSSKVVEEEKQKQKLEYEKIREQEKAATEKSLRQKFEEENKTKNKQIEISLQKEKELVEKLANKEKEEKAREAKIKEEASKEADEKHRLDKLEWEKQKADMQKTLDELQRQGKQGSQQLQGDVLERDLEERLKDAFPNDDFRPVPTGIRGGDIIQEVRNNHGNSAGSILWEAKRTKAWKKEWLSKLKDDMRSINATDCVLVTDVMPPNTKIYDRIDNTWVSSYDYAIKLASVIRYGILKVAIARSSASHSDEQLRELYEVITSDSFRQMFEARDEIINALKVELEADKRGAEKRWKRQGAYIEKLDRNNSRMYGELEAHIPSLKPLKESNLLELKDINDENEQESLI